MLAHRPLLANLLLSAAVTVVLAGGLEGVCRLLEGREPRSPVADYIWNWQTRWEGDFYTVSSDAAGWPPYEEFNADGLRDRAHPTAKPDGVWRVVSLGDSVTMGAGVKAEEAYPQVLEARLAGEGRGVEVLNIALWGWSTRQEVIAYRNIARRYAPNQVILSVCLNDIPELQNNLARPARWLSALHERSALARRIVNARSREIGSVEELLRQPDAPQVQEAYARFFAEVRTLRDEVRKDGAALSLIVFPFRFQLSPHAPAPAAQAAIQAFCAAEGLRCLDLLPALRAAGEGAFLDYDHLSPAGIGTTVDAILAAGLLPRRPSAAEVLAEAQVSAETGALLRALRHRDAPVRAAAAWALGREGGPAALTPAAVAAVAEGLRDPSETVRLAAAGALGERGATASGTRPALFEALADPREAVRWAAAQALWKIGVGSPEWVKRLAAVLRSDDAYVRAFASWTLGEIGPPAADAVPALVQALDREEAYGRGGAAAALAKLGPYAAAAVPALARSLSSPEARVRWGAARALGRIGPQAAPAVAGLITALADGDERVRSHAARALGKIGPAATAARPALEKATRDGDRSVRKEARQALAAIGPR